MKLDYAAIIEIVNKTLSQLLKINDISPAVHDRLTNLSNKAALPNMIRENFSFDDDLEKYVLINKFLKAFDRLISTHANLSDYEYGQLSDIVEKSFNNVTKDL